MGVSLRTWCVFVVMHVACMLGSNSSSSRSTFDCLHPDNKKNPVKRLKVSKSKMIEAEAEVRMPIRPAPVLQPV